MSINEHVNSSNREFQEASRDDILKKIDYIKSKIDKFKNKEKLLKTDLKNVKYKISIEALKKELCNIVVWSEYCQQALVKFQELLARWDKGIKVMKYELSSQI